LSLQIGRTIWVDETWVEWHAPMKPACMEQYVDEICMHKNFMKLGWKGLTCMMSLGGMVWANGTWEEQHQHRANKFLNYCPPSCHYVSACSAEHFILFLVN